MSNDEPRTSNLEPRTRKSCKPPKATTKPYSRHILGIDSGVQSHPKATLKPPQGATKATPMRPQSHLKATPKPGESSDVSTAPFVPYSVSGKTRCSGVLACGLGHRTALTRRSKSYTWGSHPPDTVRSPTVPPSYPHATGWLAGKKILNTENSADEGRPRLRTDARSRE